MTATMIDELRAALGAELVHPWHMGDHERHRSDYSGRMPDGIVPVAVAYPGTTAQVSAVMKACAALRIAVVPQGGLTGLAGGALPGEGVLVLSLERMNRIEDIDHAGATMVVEAGVPLQRVQEAASDAGLLFPLDLGARGSALIGGIVSTNAGGNRVLRYGMARDLTLGIEVVLADGTVIDAMNRMVKNNAGYDLKQMFIGSEGTLGIVTRAVLRLHSKPSSQNVALCAVERYEDVLRLLAGARARLGDTLSAFEVMWDTFFAVATAGDARAIGFDRPPYVVLVEMSGRDAANDAQGFQAFIEAMFDEDVITDARIAQGQRDIDRFWAIRDASGELKQRFGPAINFDVSIAVSEIDAFARACCDRLMAEVADTRVLVFGHIADGNIHLACLDEDGSRKHQVEAIVYDMVARWGGSISAEHGIGLEKRAYLHCSRSADYIALMRLLKSALDPHGLLNPGKVV